MRPQEVLANYAFAMRIVDGSFAPQPSQLKPLTYAQRDGMIAAVVAAANGNSANNSQQQQRVAVYEISGTITKADQECGPSGTITLMRRMMMNDRDPSVVGHYAKFDSGGGEATNIEEVAKFIRYELKKPKLSHFNGLMCSAAQGIGAAFDECYATLETDICGSVGVMMTLADWKAYYEKQGLKIHEVYADQSVLKNDDFAKAMEGDYTAVKEGLLNPFAANFIALIKELRPATTGHSDIFQGKTFMAKEATEKGLIDGIMTQQQAIDRVFELADKAQNPISTPTAKKSSTMFKAIAALFGGATPEADGNGNMTFSAEQVANINAAIERGNLSAEELTNVKAAQKTTEDTLVKLEEKLEKVMGRLEVVEGEPAAAPANPQAAAMGNDAAPVEEKEWIKFNKQTQADMIAGRRFFG